MYPVPLPRNLADPRPPVAIGTLAWLAAMVVLLIIGGPASWIWDCLTGVLLGLIGFAMIHWQLNSSRRGSRGVQRDLFCNPRRT